MLAVRHSRAVCVWQRGRVAVHQVAYKTLVVERPRRCPAPDRRCVDFTWTRLARVALQHTIVWQCRRYQHSVKDRRRDSSVGAGGALRRGSDPTRQARSSTLTTKTRCDTPIASRTSFTNNLVNARRSPGPSTAALIEEVAEDLFDERRSSTCGCLAETGHIRRASDPRYQPGSIVETTACTSTSRWAHGLEHVYAHRAATQDDSAQHTSIDVYGDACCDSRLRAYLDLDGRLRSGLPGQPSTPTQLMCNSSHLRGRRYCRACRGALGRL